MWLKKEVIKHSSAIHISNNVNLLQRRTFNVLLANAYNKLPTQETFQASVQDLCDMLGYSSKNLDHLKKSLRGLVTTSVEWNILNKDGSEEWGVSSLQSEIKIINGICHYSYSPTLREKLYNPKMYAKISLSLQNNFKSKHALAIYELLTDYFNIKKGVSRTPYIKIPVFRKLLGLDENEYADFKILNRDIIKKAIKEINKVSDLYVEIVFKKKGRRVDKLQFTIRQNKENAVKIKDLESKSVQMTLPEPSLEIDNQQLLQTLINEFGININKAVEILKKYDELQVEKSLEVVREEIKKGKVRSIPGLTIKAIEENYTSNKIILAKKRKEKELEKLKKAEQKRLLQEKKEKERAEKQAKLDDFFNQLTSQKQQELLKEFEQTLDTVMLKFYKKSGVKSPIVSGTYYNFLDKKIKR